MAYNLSSLFGQITAILARHPNIKLSELSRELAVERHTLEKAIRLDAGKSFREFRQQLLLDQAKRLLRAEGNLSTKEIAFRLGFGSQRAFARFVKRASALTATELRRSRKWDKNVPVMSKNLP